jgi:hypothetical protein
MMGMTIKQVRNGSRNEVKMMSMLIPSIPHNATDEPPRKVTKAITPFNMKLITAGVMIKLRLSNRRCSSVRTMAKGLTSCQHDYLQTLAANAPQRGSPKRGLSLESTNTRHDPFNFGL